MANSIFSSSWLFPETVSSLSVSAIFWALAIEMKEEMVLAIEPMINMGKKEVYTEDDGWTVRTIDHKPSVHFEHDVCVRKNKADILSDYSIIEKVERANINLYSSVT